MWWVDGPGEGDRTLATAELGEEGRLEDQVSGTAP